MIHLLVPIIFLIAGSANGPWEESLDPQDAMTYIRAAEDLSADGIRSSSERTLITHLYVLSAIIDPVNRNSAILGVISIESDENLILQLKNLLHSSPSLVPSVVNSGPSLIMQSNKRIESACATLMAMRQGKTISDEEALSIRPWSFMFPQSFDVYFQDTQRRKKNLNRDEIETTFKVELEVLGGSSLWSADVATSGGNPVVMSMSDDLATLLSVDPTKKYRNNGRWVNEPKN
jgi:hypothetical protein